MMDKKGNIVTIIFFIFVLFFILICGFIVVMGSAVLNYVFDIITPELTSLGEVGNVNFTLAGAMTITPLNSIIQSFTWLTGLIFIMALLGSIAIVVMARETPNGWLIGFYFLLMIVLVMGAMFMSNIYEDFYDDGDEISIRLKEHAILSFMILYSPHILTIIGFIAGAILFSGIQSEVGI